MATAAAEMAERVGRWPGLDLVRALAVGGLIPFHAALVFDATDDFYVKSDRTADLTPFAAPVVVAAMPLLFLAAGIGAWHSWRARGAGIYVRRRLRRLLVPLVAGTVLLVPLPVWLRQRAEPGYDESYAASWRAFFHIRWDWSEFPFVLQPAGGRGFETGHLWFVYLLLLYSLAVLPLLGWLGSARGGRALGVLADWTELRGVVLLPALILGAIAAGLGLDEGIAAGNALGYLLFFAAGAVMAADPRFREVVRRDAGLAAAVAVTLLAVAGGALLSGEDGDPLLGRDPLILAGRAAYGAAGWCAVVAIIGGLARLGSSAGVSRRGGSRASGRLLRYAAPAVLAWYVLHQPVVVAVAYFVVGSPLHPALEYLLICTASAVVTLLAYDLLIRRTALTRSLFAGT